MPVIMKENVQYAYTDKGVKAHTLSYAEYQALSAEEKMNGDLYFIPDKQPEGNPSLIWDKLGTSALDTEADNVSDAVNELNSSLAQRAFVGSQKSISVTVPAGNTVNVNDADYVISGKTYIGTLIYSYEGAHVSITTGYAGITAGIRFVVHNFNSLGSLTITINYRHLYI